MKEASRKACIAAVTVYVSTAPSQKKMEVFTIDVAGLPCLLDSTRNPIAILVIRSHLHTRSQCREDQREHVWVPVGVAFCISHEAFYLSPGDLVRSMGEVAGLSAALKHFETFVDHVFVRHQ